MNLNCHPYAELFPLLPEDQLQELADDIKKNGLHHPIVIDADERIVDGRNRARACEIAGINPDYEPLIASDADVLKYVLSQNLHRRHLTESQRAMVAAELANIQNGHNRHQAKVAGAIALPTSTKQAADAMNVSPDSVKRAKQVKTKGTPELQKAVMDGEISVSKAAKIVDAEKPVAKKMTPKPTSVQWTMRELESQKTGLRFLMKGYLGRWPPDQLDEALELISKIHAEYEDIWTKKKAANTRLTAQ